MVLQTEIATVGTEGDEALLERRRGLRIRQSRPVKIFEPASRRYFPGQTEDISSSGLRIELPASAPIGPGRMLSIHVGMGERGESLAGQRQMLPARVVWVDRQGTAGRGRVTVGVQFLAVAAAQMDAA